MIADVQRSLLYALSRQLRSAAPLERPPLNFSISIRCFDGNKRMRIAKHELDEISFELYRFLSVVNGGKGVVSICRRAKQERRECESKQHSVFHHFLPG